jgi:peptide/nickel transport system permease protein
MIGRIRMSDVSSGSTTPREPLVEAAETFDRPRPRRSPVRRLWPRLRNDLVFFLVAALVIALVIAIPVGIVSATRPNTKIDAAATVLAVSGVALPEFFVGILLIYLFAVGLRLLPPSGYVPFSAGVWPNLKSIILPALSLGLTLNAVTMRQVRASLIEVLQEEYVTVARAKGLPEREVIRVHALKNAMIPVITVIGLQIGRLFGGTVVVETIFAFPGMGRLAADSIFFRDFPVLQGVVLVMALAVLACNLLTDLLYAYVDPRIRYA